MITKVKNNCPGNSCVTESDLDKMAHDTKCRRSLGANERLFLAFDDTKAPCVFDIVLEGRNEFSESEWRCAVHRASAAHSGARLRLRRHWHGLYWEESDVYPDCISMPGEAWDGRSNHAMPWDRAETFPLETGPCCQVLLLSGEPSRVVLRVHHGVMDGYGVLFWLTDILRVLNRQEPIGGSCALNIHQFGKMLAHKLEQSRRVERKSPVPDKPIAQSHFLTPLGQPRGTDCDIEWRRISISCDPSTSPLPQILAFLTGAATDAEHPHARFMVPVNLRIFQKDSRNTGNLSSVVFLDTTTEQSVANIQGRLRRVLLDRRQVLPDQRASMQQALPLWFFKRSAHRELRKTLTEGRYAFSSIATHIGNFDVDAYSIPGFSIDSVFAIAPAVDTVPLNVVSICGRDTAEITLAAPRYLTNHGRLEALADDLNAHLRSIL